MSISDLTPDNTLTGATDGTEIGNVGDSLKTIISSDIDSPPVVALPSGVHDAFGRLRVSNPETLFTYSHRYNVYHGTYFDTELTGSAAATHDNDTVSHFLNTTTAINDRVIHSTKRYFQYLKGKSQLIYFTVNFDDLYSGCDKRAGYYDDMNGVFINATDTPEIIIRSSASGSTVDTIIDRTNWDDKLDGTGASGATIDWGKQNLFQIDFTWLGSGKVRFSVEIDGMFIVFHTYKADGLETPYTQSGNLPLRFEIENITAQGAARKMSITCMSVISEGGSVSEGRKFAADTGLTEVSVTTTPTIVLGIRMNSATNRASIKAGLLKLHSPSGNKTTYWRVLFNPTIVGGTWAANPEGGIADLLTGFTSFSGGKLLNSGYLEPNNSAKTTEGAELENSDLYLGRTISGTSDTLVLVAETFSSTSKLLMSGNWREYI